MQSPIVASRKFRMRALLCTGVLIAVSPLFCVGGGLVTVIASKASAAPDSPGGAATTVAQPNGFTLAFHWQDARLDECSGMVASRRNPGITWAHNDSGDVPRLFAVDPSGKTVAVCTLLGAPARDWEDIAIGGDGENTFLYVGDIGDNGADRRTVQIYRVREPLLTVGAPEQAISLQAETMEVTRPEGPADAETLLAFPDGNVALLTKGVGGSTLYRTNGGFRAGTQQMVKVASLKFGETSLFSKLATGGEISPDGTRLAVVTYTDIYEWKLARPWQLEGVEQLTPVQVRLPALRQCEAVCYTVDGKYLAVSSEKAGAPVYRIASPLAGK